MSSPASDADALARFFAAGAREDDADHARLWAALQDASEGGKRVRPLLFTSAHTAMGGVHMQAAAEVAGALELLHTALVVHDDIIDGDDLRRGRPNVAGTFMAMAVREGAGLDRARRYGTAAGILAGDLALVGAVRMVAMCGAPPLLVRRLLDLLDDALHVTAAAELADVRLSLIGGALDGEAVRVSAGKTAAYSFRLPLQMAAVLAGADDHDTERLGRFGWLLGTAFQLRDDIQGVFGRSERTGKSSLSDLREGKETALIAHARTTDRWDRIAPYVGRPDVDETDLDAVRELLHESGTREFVETMAIGMAQRAADEIVGMPVESTLRVWLAAVTRDLRSAA
jgi:geranylgeranyl diphosphate synthase type II